MICKKCGYQTGGSAKFCAACGSAVVPVQEVEIEYIVDDSIPVSAKSVSVEPDVVIDFPETADEAVATEVNKITDEEVVEALSSSGSSLEPLDLEEPEIIIYNSEMPAQQNLIQSEAAASAEPAIAPQAAEGNVPEATPVSPAYPGAATYGVPTGQTYNGVPVYVIPNAPVYNSAPNGAIYSAAPVYAPVYNNAPAYTAPVQPYPASPVYAAPVASAYAPQEANAYTPEPHSEELAPKRKTVSIAAVMGSIVAILAFFLKLSHVLPVSMFNIVSEDLPDLIDSIKYIDMYDTAQYLVMTMTVICLLCALFSLIVFILSCLKVNCRVMAILSMVLIVGLVVVNLWLRLEWSYAPETIDFEYILGMIEYLSVGFWLYFGGMLVAAIGGGKR